MGYPGVFANRYLLFFFARRDTHNKFIASYGNLVRARQEYCTGLTYFCHGPALIEIEAEVFQQLPDHHRCMGCLSQFRKPNMNMGAIVIHVADAEIVQMGSGKTMCSTKAHKGIRSEERRGGRG